MTAKRFTLKGFDGVRCDLFDGDVELAEVHKEDAKELCNLLNELHEENMMLKGAVAYYKLMLMSLEEEAKRMSQIHCRSDVE